MWQNGRSTTCSRARHLSQLASCTMVLHARRLILFLSCPASVRISAEYYSCADKETCGCKARKIVDRPKVRHWRGDSVRDLVDPRREHNHGVLPSE